MPSAYTSKIHDGENVTFPEFAMTCARAFGALIEMKEESLEVPVPEKFEPAPYYVQRVKQARERLADTEAWTPEQAEARAARVHAEAVADTEQSNATATARRQRYGEMLASVRDWEPPTPDHQSLKDFMVEQLQESIRFDCHTLPVPVRLGGVHYKETKVREHRTELDRAMQALEQEKQRTKGRTEWVRALRASLLAPAPAESPS